MVREEMVAVAHCQAGKVRHLAGRSSERSAGLAPAQLDLASATALLAASRASGSCRSSVSCSVNVAIVV
jgi:hypothetical protein